MIKKSHLSYFKVNNFKRFDSLLLDNLGQINLIVGDNNIGKTSVLESLLFSENSTEFLHNYHRTLCFRNLHIHPKQVYSPQNGQLLTVELPKINYLSFLLKDIEQALEIEYAYVGQKKQNLSLETMQASQFTGDDKNTIAPHTAFGFRFFVNDVKKEVGGLVPSNYSMHENYIPFVPINKGYKGELVAQYYDAIHNSKAKRKEFKDNLQLLIPDIEDVLPSKINDDEVLSVYLKEKDNSVPITRYGDGTIKLMRILLAITKSEQSRLMIDEIADGIHHSRLADYWAIIITACIKNDVQLFATTHSLECLQKFVTVLKREAFTTYQPLSRVIKLTEIHADEVRAFTHSYPEFAALVETETEIRG